MSRPFPFSHSIPLSVVEFLFQTHIPTHGTLELTEVFECFQGVSLCQSLCFHRCEERDDESRAGLSVSEPAYTLALNSTGAIDTTFGFDAYVITFHFFFFSPQRCMCSGSMVA